MQEMIGMNYEQARELMKNARDPARGKPIGNNTRLYSGDGTYEIKLHGNTILVLHPDGFCPTNAGWPTVTTKARLNEHMEMGQIYQQNFVWYYRLADMVYLFDEVHFVVTHPEYNDDERVLCLSQYTETVIV